MTDYELQLVEWIDSAGSGRWESLKDHAQASPKVIRSIGWVLRDDKEAVTLAQSIDDADEELVPMADNSICIPRVAVRKQRRLVPPKKGTR